MSEERLLGRRLNSLTMMWEAPGLCPVPAELMTWIDVPGPITMLDLVATLCRIDRREELVRRGRIE